MKPEEKRATGDEGVGAPKGAGKRRPWALLAGLCLAVVLAAGAAYAITTGALGVGGSDERAAGGDPAPAEAPPEHPALGSPDAPVTMIEYSDFQCPYCGKYARETEPQLIERYVEDGTLRIEWRDFPYLGRESVNAALAARAAGAQGEFWSYHDLLYEEGGAPNSGTFSEERLLELAREAGLDVERFEREIKGGEYEAAVAADFEEGQRRGVTGTPTFFINGEVLVGAQPTGVFVEKIDEAAERAEGG